MKLWSRKGLRRAYAPALMCLGFAYIITVPLMIAIPRGFSDLILYGLLIVAAVGLGLDHVRKYERTVIERSDNHIVIEIRRRRPRKTKAQ